MILFSLFPVLTHYSKWVTGSCPLILKFGQFLTKKKMKNIILCYNLKGPVDYLKLHKYLSFKKVYWIFYSFLMLSNNYHYNFLVFPFGWSFFAQFLILFLDTSPSWLWYMLSYNVKKTYLEIMVLSNVFILMSNLIFKRTNSIPGHKWVFLIFSHTFQQLLFVWILIWRWK